MTLNSSAASKHCYIPNSVNPQSINDGSHLTFSDYYLAFKKYVEEFIACIAAKFWTDWACRMKIIEGESIYCNVE